MLCETLRAFGVITHPVSPKQSLLGSRDCFYFIILNIISIMEGFIALMCFILVFVLIAMQGPPKRLR